ncbi:protein kinase [Thalassoglobus sp. JC818]|uniref:protein kinase domain-containing protein n=1 Tax=Thalassoglobus sp. JC818 TaxID=3232136 RepID=UPI0034586174
MANEPQTSACLPQDLLIGLLLDSLTKEEQLYTAEHVQTCKICQRELETICEDRAIKLPESSSVESESGDDSIANWSGKLAQKLMGKLQQDRPVPTADSPMQATIISSEEASAASEQTVSRGAMDSETSLTQQHSSRAGSSIELHISETFGRYKVEKILGQGAMGAVYLARDTQLDRDVALKIPKFGLNNNVGDQELLERFYREARAAATLRSPYICPVHDVGEIEGQHYISMAYIEGRPLKDFTKSKKKHSERQIVTTVRKLAQGLAEAHEIGVVHRDLKPANIMVDRKGEPVVMDFGLARRSSSDDVQVTQSGAIMGTPAYMSPEQVEGDQDKIGPQADIYALGIIMYELITGEMPYKGSLMSILKQIALNNPKKPSELRPNLDPRLERICLKMIAGDREQRYQSMNDVAADLQEVIKTPAPTKKKDKNNPTKSQTNSKSAGTPSEESTPVLISVQEPQSYAERLRKSKLKVTKSNSSVKQKTANLNGNHRKMLAWTGGAIAGILLLFGILITFKSKDGTITLEIPDGYEDRVVIEVLSNGETVGEGWRITPDMKSKTLNVQIGQVKLKIKDGFADSYTLTPNEFTLGKTQIVKLTRIGGKSPTTEPVAGNASTSDPRRFVEWILSNGGDAIVNGLTLKKIDDLSQISGSDFNVTSIGLSNKPNAVTSDFDALPKLTQLEAIHLHSCGVDDSIGKQIEQLSRLEYLTLNGCPVSNECLKHLEKLSNLNNLQLNGTKITDDGMASVRRLPSLVSLALMDTEIGDAGLQHLKHSPRLRTLFLGSSKVTTAGVADFREAKPDCNVGWSGETQQALAAAGSTQQNSNSIASSAGLQFDGLDDYVHVPSITYDGESPLTIEVRLRSDSPQDSQILRIHDAGSPSLYIGWYENHDPAISFYNHRPTATDYFRAEDLWDGHPTVIAAVVDSDVTRLFIDGRKIGLTRSDSFRALSQHRGLSIGAEFTPTPLHHFRGVIEEVRLSGAALYDEDYIPPVRFDARSDTLALYKFNEGTGDILKDSSGNGHDGKVYGATWVSPINTSQVAGTNFALDFNPTGKLPATDGVRIPELIDDGSVQTIEFWSQRRNTESTEKDFDAHLNIVCFGTGFGVASSDENEFSFTVRLPEDERPLFKLGSNPGIEQPVHVAGIRDFDKREYRLYIDGNFIASKPFGTLLDMAAPLSICDQNYQPELRMYSGWIDEVRLSSIPRYDSDFVPLKRFETDSNTTALYHFDEGTGDLLKDSSGNGHDGKIFGAKWVSVPSASVSERDIAE